jgi:hypothetical protein
MIPLIHTGESTEHMLGGARSGEVAMWGSAADGKASAVITDAFAGGAAAVAERLWSDPPPRWPTPTAHGGNQGVETEGSI